MSSSFKNFFITFSICLLVFAVLGVFAFQTIVGGFDQFATGNSSATESENESETSETISVPEQEESAFFDENGDVFTAVVMCVDEENTVVKCMFIDANGKTKQYIQCQIPPSTRISDASGNTVPIADVFGTMSPEEICECVSAMTGIETKYCFRFQKDDMSKIASFLVGPSIKLSSPVEIPLVDKTEDAPEGEDSEESEEEQEAKTVVIENDENGEVRLNASTEGKSNLEWLLGAKDESNKIYGDIAEEFYDCFFKSASKTQKVATLNTLSSISDNNFSAKAAQTHIGTIFSRGTFNTHDVFTYTKWESEVERIRRLDGSFDRKQSND